MTRTPLQSRLRRLLLVTLLAAPALLPAQQQLRVLSYNIHHGEGMDGRIDLERIAGVIRSVQPDIVALQEVDRKTERSKGVDQAEELARLTGMKMFYGKTIPHQGGEYGNAVLSRLPAKLVANHPLPGQEPRGVIEIDAQLKGAHFAFFATHFDATRDESFRLDDAAGLVKLASGLDKPGILAGDLNTVPDSAVMARLEAQWLRAGNPSIFPTIPVGTPRRQIDYVMVRPVERWRVIEVKVLDEAIASDHRAIFAVLELLTP